MDFNAILAPVLDFLSTDFGGMVVNALQGVFNFLFPANAPAVPGA
jgi:hypothetical protein